MPKRRKISNKQKAAIKRLTAFTSFAWPSDPAIYAFFDVTDLGIKPLAAMQDLSDSDKLQFNSLLSAHTINSRTPSPLFEGLIIEGLEDISILELIWEYEHLEDPEEKERREPAYKRLIALANTLTLDQKLAAYRNMLAACRKN